MIFAHGLFGSLLLCACSIQTMAQAQVAGDANTDPFSAELANGKENSSPAACQFQIVDGQLEYLITNTLPQKALGEPSKYDKQHLVDLLSRDSLKCMPAPEKLLEEVTLRGRSVLSDATLIEADLIHIESDAELVTNGFELQLRARKLLTVEGRPLIRSFLPREQNVAAGTNGRNAGLISIEAAKVEGSKLTIDNSGEDGVAGKAGEDGKAGARGKPGRAGTDKGIRGCVGRQNGGTGKNGGRGKPGGRGGDAGNGGPVSLRIDDQSFEGSYDRLVVIQSRINPYTNTEYRCKGSCPGSAGIGGEGGKGGSGGPGGISPRGQWPCIGGGVGKKGKPGRTGKKGADGREGEAGSVLIF